MWRSHKDEAQPAAPSPSQGPASPRHARTGVVKAEAQEERERGEKSGQPEAAPGVGEHHVPVFAGSQDLLREIAQIQGFFKLLLKTDSEDIRERFRFC